jgi:hypothetical protein
LISAAIDTT